MLQALRHLKPLTPPLVWNLARKLTRSTPARPRFLGPVPSWDQALRASDGWDAPPIIAKTLAAALMVRDGRAASERDGIARDRVLYSPTLLAALCMALAKGHQHLRVIDFGGSLGTHYFQHRTLLQHLISRGKLHWSVVEQAAFVAQGREQFERDDLKFFASIEDAMQAAASQAPDLLLFTGSLQCLAKPFEMIDRAIATGTPLIAIDRLLTGLGPEHEIYIQQPDPQKFYPATYPTWCFAKPALVRFLSDRGFSLIEEFPTRPGTQFDSCGMLFAHGQRHA